MCLAVPGQIKSIEELHGGLLRKAQVSFGGIIKSASLEMLPSAEVGDYVLVHVGVAISKVDEEEARKTFEYLREIGEVGELTDIDEYLPKSK
ncbi:MAG: HypC/HybG/HupF family hydrogenase formation chaperone [Schleiferiaceae bacterium]|jgi:hydrogenase expression/formation protein HypC